MKRTINNWIGLSALAAMLTTTVVSCKDEVNLPAQILSLSTDTIKAPAFAADFTFDVSANCDWKLFMEGNDGKWADVSQNEAVGPTTITLSVKENTGTEPRMLRVKVAAVRNMSMTEELIFVQEAGNVEGYMSVADVRALAVNGSYTIPSDAKMRAIIVSSSRYGNFFVNCLALQGSSEAGSGIALRTDEEVMLSAGEEVEIDLKGAEVTLNAATGVVELRPVSDDKVIRTDNEQVALQSTVISVSDLLSGDYESMYVTVNDVQVLSNDLLKSKLSDDVSLQTSDDERFVLQVLDEAVFAENSIPSGSGSVSGLAVPYSGSYALMPRSEEDIRLEATRFGGGVNLPYVFSFLTTGKNYSGKYVSYTYKDANNKDLDVDTRVMQTTDGTGTTLTFDFCDTVAKYGEYWHKAHGHDCVRVGAWKDGGTNFFQFTYKLGENIENGFRFSIGIGRDKSGCSSFNLMYSTDNENWYMPEGTPHIVIPENYMVSATGSASADVNKHFFYYTVDVPVTEIPLKKGDTFYVRIAANVKASGRNRIHSCAVLENIPSYKTSTPAGAVYFEPFDQCVDGLDYRLGDKLAGMMNYCGSDISEWNTTNRLSGTHVHQRPGYVQIGYVDTQYTACEKYRNEVGELNTPALGVNGDLNLSFRAMAYKNMSLNASDGSVSLDYGGDIQSVVVEVIGGGTINGETKTVVSGLSYTNFKSVSLKIEGATAGTSLRFTSEPKEGEFSRWFIDEICVTK